ncbi:NAD-dependent epimerase/dehydratase family protein [Streptomyces avicenniae]|uniref:NAD-dependent epimerase/dehydratase family protein n=1 Tax=Streptomyces avicenniae TaxID=500153 RepID=UPI00069C69B9|nr:NAD-dependent epimerase/dehydratase family protein [Streptomyces avicenniae]
MTAETVLVTGGSGFLATRCVAQALRRGYAVRATVRAPGKERRARLAVAAAGVPEDAPLSFSVADLTRDDGWAEAAEGCAYLLHVASPLPATPPAHEDDLVRPAREGTLRVLRAARDAGVRRAVVTSSFAAIGYGHPPTDRPFTEDDWTDTGADVGAYVRSKTLAERAAWDLMDREGGDMTLTVINPTGIFGPVLGPDLARSIGLVKALLDGTMRRTPKVRFAVVDSRDAAELHLLAMTDPRAAGQRFIAASGDTQPLHALALTLRQGLGPAARRVPTRDLPTWALRLLARFTPRLRDAAANAGVVRHLDDSKARDVLGWRPRPAADTLLDTARSLIDQGLVTPPPGTAPR